MKNKVGKTCVLFQKELPLITSIRNYLFNDKKISNMNAPRKLYMNLQGITMTESYAKQYYGDRFETAILAKVLVDEDGETIGTW